MRAIICRMPEMRIFLMIQKLQQIRTLAYIPFLGTGGLDAYYIILSCTAAQPVQFIDVSVL